MSISKSKIVDFIFFKIFKIHNKLNLAKCVRTSIKFIGI